MMRPLAVPSVGTAAEFIHQSAEVASGIQNCVPQQGHILKGMTLGLPAGFLTFRLETVSYIFAFRRRLFGSPDQPATISAFACRPFARAIALPHNALCDPSRSIFQKEFLKSASNSLIGTDKSKRRVVRRPSAHPLYAQKHAHTTQNYI
jgi:hypothetical protein